MPKTPRQKKLYNFDTAQYIGILFSTDDNDWKEQLASFLNFLRSKKIKYNALGYISKKGISEDDCLSVCHYFHKHDVNWVGTPKSNSMAGNFMKEPFDILINCSSKDSDVFRFITTVSPAHCKIGTRDKKIKPSPYDLMLEISNKRSTIAPFLDVLKEYLPVFCHDSKESSDKANVILS